VRPVPIGRRPSFADIGQTVAEFLEVPPLAAGTSFLSEVWSD
jgi:phosphopentomutase